MNRSILNKFVGAALVAVVLGGAGGAWAQDLRGTSTNRTSTASNGRTVRFIQHEAGGFVANQSEGHDYATIVRFYEIRGGSASNEFEINIPASINGVRIKNIGAQVFERPNYTDRPRATKFRTVTFPEGLEGIWWSAFGYNQISELHLPNSLRVVQREAFRNNPITRVTIGANVQLGSNSIARGFNKAYNGGGKQAGTYVLNGRVWTRE